MFGERATTNEAIIIRAILARACLSGTHVSFRVRFAPHAFGLDEQGKRSVVAFEYGGMTVGQSNWVCFAVDRLRALHLTSDPWRTGSLESRPTKANLTDVEAAIDASWRRTI